MSILDQASDYLNSTAFLDQLYQSIADSLGTLWPLAIIVFGGIIAFLMIELVADIVRRDDD